jgi:autotransporter translocation and assembly factor TamB
VRSQLTLHAKDFAFAAFGIQSGTARLSALHNAPFTRGQGVASLESKLEIEAEGVSGRSLRADSVKLALETQGHTVDVRLAEVRRAENLLSVSGSYEIPQKSGQSAMSAMKGKFTLDAPQLDAFGIRVRGEVLKGVLHGQGDFERIRGELNGSGRIEGKEFQIGGFRARRLGAAVGLAGKTATVEEAALELNNKDRIAVAGKLHLAAPFLYEGGVIVSVADLGVFQPLLDVFKIPGPLKGGLELDWNGHAQTPEGADPSQRAQSGELKLRLTKARYGALNLDQFSLAGTYRPGFAQSSELKLLSGPTRLEGVLEWEEGKLRLRDIALDQGKQHALTGYIILPLDLNQPKNPVALDQRIAANVNLKDLDLGQLLASFGKTSPVTGAFSASLIAGGTLLAPSAHLKVTGRKLQAKSMPQLDPSELDLALHYANKDLSLDATLRNKQFQPLSLKGRLPVDLAATLQNRAIDREMPLDVQLRLPASPLNSLPKLVPAIRRADGTVAIEVNAGGTIGTPVIQGAASVKIASLRMSKENIPPLSAFEAQLLFAEDKVTLKTFRGEVAGGRLDLGGQIDLKKPAEPVFDLRMKADKVLVRRDDAITVRIDTDLRLAGPLNTALASGTVFITESRFFREIDLIPIGLPGKPKPKPRAAPSAKTFSLPRPPFRDWKFDIAIRTRSSDPFRIRGNLANGTAAADVKLTGTGLQPNLEGNVRVENFVASLPFSKLSVNQGFLYFSPESPLDPSLDLQAESTVRDYRVTAYVYGNVSDPQVTMISEPPLPQAEIISLLATGTTTSELNGNSQGTNGGLDVRTGRAAVLVFQQLYRKVFKTRETPQESSFLDRFSVDLGAVDSRTGRQEVATSFRLGKHLYLIGELDVEGDFTGRLRYLLRFR